MRSQGDLFSSVNMPFLDQGCYTCGTKGHFKRDLPQIQDGFQVQQKARAMVPTNRCGSGNIRGSPQSEKDNYQGGHYVNGGSGNT